MGGSKSRKRRSLGSLSSKKSKAKRSKAQVIPANVDVQIVVDDKLEDDDEYIKRLVEVKKAQINQSRYIAVRDAGGANISTKPRATRFRILKYAGSNSTSLPKAQMENERNEPSETVISPKKVKINIVNSEPKTVTQTNDFPQTPIPKSESHKKKKKKKRTTSTTVGDTNTTIAEFQPPPTKPAPLLPKRVTLKKNLMDMIQQIVARRNNSDDKKVKSVKYGKRSRKSLSCQPPSPPIKVPVIADVNQVGVQNTSEQFKVTPVPYIDKNDINMSTDVLYEVVPKLEGISVPITLPPLQLENRAVDKSITDDIAPLVVNTTMTNPLGSANLDKYKSKEKWSEQPSSSKTDFVPYRPIAPRCTKCNLSFLNSTGFSTHMREFHKVESRDSSNRVLVSVPREFLKSTKQISCDFCSFLSTSEAGLKLHTRYKHPETFKSKQKRKSNHIAGEGSEKFVYVCYLPHCQQQFSSLLNLQLHKTLNHEYTKKKPIPCVLCIGKFQTPMSLLYHLRTVHTGVVDTEGYSVFDTSGRRNKQPDPKVLPPTGVPQKKIQEQGTREKPTCPQCNISFQWEANLEVHMQEFHSGLRIVSVSGNRKSSTGKQGTSLRTGVPVLSKSKSSGLISSDTSKSKVTEIITLSDDDESDEIEIIPSKKSPTTTSCPYCSLQVPLNEFATHVDMHASVVTYEIKKFSCPHSGCTTERTFSSFKEVQDHSMEIHHTSFDRSVSEPNVDVTEYVCSLCPNRSSCFSWRKLYDDHLRDAHGIVQRDPLLAKDVEELPLIICNLCDNLKFSSLKSLKKHCQRIHPGTSSDKVHGSGAMSAASVLGNKKVRNHSCSVEESATSSSMFTVTPIATRSSDTTLTVTPITTISHPRVQVTHNRQNKEKEAETANKSMEVFPLLCQAFKCPICASTEFNSQISLDEHMLQHQSDDIDITPSLDDTNSFFCVECNLQFDSLDDTNQHAVNIHKKSRNDRPILCPICYLLVKQARNLPRHIFSKHRMYQCVSCFQIMTGYKNYSKHQDLHLVRVEADGGNLMIVQYRCLECLQTFTSKSHLGLHYESLHRGGPKCTCITCGVQIQRKNLQLHLELHRNKNIISTSAFHGTNTSSYSQMELTQGIYHESEGGEPIPCTESGCTETFNNLISLELHLKQRQINTASPVQTEPSFDQVESILPDGGINEEEAGSTFHISLSYPTSTDFEFEDVDIGEETGETNPLEEREMRSDYINQLGPSTSTTVSQSFNYNYMDCDVEQTSAVSEFGEPLSVESSGGYSSEGIGLETEGFTPVDGATNSKSFLCSLCPKRFVRRDNRDLHMKKVHEDSISYQCSYCGECYKNDVAFTRHVNSVHLSANEQIKPYVTPGRRGRPRGSGSNGPGRPRSRIHSVPTGRSTECQYCGLSFRGVMERRKHELIHFGPLEMERDEPTSMSSRRISMGMAEQMQQVQEPMNVQDFFDDEGGMLNAENIFLPLEIMMKADVELPATTGDEFKESQGSSTGVNSSPQPTYIPESLDEFIALL